MKNSMLIGIIIFAVIIVGGIGVAFLLGDSNDDTNTSIDNSLNSSPTVSNDKESSSYKMEKVVAGKYSFMVPDNGDKKYANGDTQQTFYSKDGEEGYAWYSLEGPLEAVKDKKAAHNITRSAGSVIEFEYDKDNGVEQSFIINEYEGEYEGLRIVVSLDNPNDCIWLNVIGTDKKLVETILNSLKW